MDADLRGLRLAWEQSMPIDLLKAVQAALLAELPRAAVLEFWARHPLTLFKDPLAPSAFLRFLWDGDGKVPPGYFWSVMQDLEGFLEERRVNAERFFQLINHGAQGGPPLDPTWVIQNLEAPKASAPRADLREWLLAGLHALCMRLLPGSYMEPIRAQSSDAGVGSRSRLFLFQPLARVRDLAAPDFRLFPGKLLTALPRLFGHPAFNALDVPADSRGPGQILADVAGEEWNWKGDILRRGKKRAGRLMSLEKAMEDWPEASVLSEALGRVLRAPVVRMERDVASSQGGRARLRAGCIYASPIAFLRIGYAPNRRWERVAALLSHKPPLPDARVTLHMAETLHRELLASLG